jgi:hypothetical protein
MILPTKHISLSNSLVGVGAELLKCVDTPRTVSSLWNDARSLSQINSFEQFTLCLDFLYCLGVVDFEDGLVRRLKG